MTSIREEVVKYIKKKYKASPENLWRSYPDYAVSDGYIPVSNGLSDMISKDFKKRFLEKQVMYFGG